MVTTIPNYHGGPDEWPYNLYTLTYCMIGQIVHTETEIKTTPNYPGNTTAQPAISVKHAWIWPLHEYDSH